jgi:RNA polymerase-binding transcription factor DksA
VPQIDPVQVKARLDERIRQIEERREAIRRDDEGMRDELADYDQHPGDQGTETYIQEMDATTDIILDEEEQRVKDARRALDEGRYGVCVDCGKEIPPARLKAAPESIRCVDDQRRFEALLRQRGGDASR